MLERIALVLKPYYNTRTASSPDFNNLLKRSIEASKGMGRQKLQKILNRGGETAAFISASRQTNSRKENKRRTSDLIKDLQGETRTKDFYKLKGRYAEEETGKMKSETSIMAIGLDFEEIMKLREKYDQDSIIFKGKDNVIGMYDGKQVYISKPLTDAPKKKDNDSPKEKEEPNPYKENRKEKSEVLTDPKEKSESWTQFRNVGLSLDFVWDDPVKWDSNRAISINDLDKSGFFEKHDINPKDYKTEIKDWKKDKKKKQNSGISRDEFLKTKVKNPATGNDVQIGTLSKYDKNTPEYKLYLDMLRKWKGSKA